MEGEHSRMVFLGVGAQKDVAQGPGKLYNNSRYKSIGIAWRQGFSKVRPESAGPAPARRRGTPHSGDELGEVFPSSCKVRPITNC